MTKHMYKIAIILIIAAGNIMLFQNCDKKMQFSTSNGSLVNIGEGDGSGDDVYNPGEGDGIPNPNDPNDPDNPENNPDVPECTVTYKEIETPVKILFMIDKTGSNVDNSFTPAAGDGTDVNKSWRMSIINNLKDGLDPDLFSFNFTLFRGNAANPNDGYRYNGELTKSLINGFSKDANVVSAAISAFQNDPDQGRTPHQAALEKAKEIVAADIAVETDTTVKYSVIMITDGHPEPNLVTIPGCTDPNAQAPMYSGKCADVPASVNVAKGLAADIVNINPQRVNVNTIYYYSAGQRSSNAIDILKGVAEAGKGHFIEATSSNYSIDFKNIIRVPANTCP